MSGGERARARWRRRRRGSAGADGSSAAAGALAVHGLRDLVSCGADGGRGGAGAAALEALGSPVTLVPDRHPVVDIVPFEMLTVDLAADRGTDPDPIRRDDPRWARAREAHP